MANHEMLPAGSFYRALFEQDAVGVALTETATGRFVHVNQRCCDITGYSPEQMVALTFQAITHPDDLPAGLDRMRQLVAGRIRAFTMQKRYLRQDGAVVWVNLTVSPLWPSGEPAGYHLAITEDITERKRAEAALQESESLIRAIGNNLPNCMLYQIIRDKAGNRRFAYVSDAVRRFYGCSAAEAMADPGLIYGRVVEADRQRVLAEEENAFATLSTFAMEVAVQPPSGGPRWSYFASSPRLLEDGSTCWDGIEIDITDRKKAEEALRVSEESYRLLFEAESDAIFLVDNESGQILQANPAACALYGYSHKQILSLRNTDLSDQPEQTRKVTAQTAPAPDTVVTIPLRWHRKKDGTAFPVEITGRFFIRAGRGVHIAAIRDISGRLASEEALRESEERLRLAMQAANQGFYDLNVQTGETIVSEEYARMLGYDPATFHETNAACFQRIHPDDVVRVIKVYDDYIAGKIADYRVEFRQRTAAGRWQWILSQGKIMERDDQGRPLRMLGTHTDITERKALEDQLLQAQKMESVGRLAGGVAHDFNNMLQTILGFTDLALGQIPREDPVHGHLLLIRQAGERSADLTRQLLAFARKQTVSPKVLDLNDTVAGMLKMLRRLIGEDIELIWKPGPNLWAVSIDPSQVDQILANLAVNARDAIAGAGNLTIETQNAFLDEAYCRTRAGFVPGQHVALAVSDDGCGMEKKVLDHLFEPFFTTKEVGKGTGLGLATVYGIGNGFARGR